MISVFCAAYPWSCLLVYFLHRPVVSKQRHVSGQGGKLRTTKQPSKILIALFIIDSQLLILKRPQPYEENLDDNTAQRSVCLVALQGATRPLSDWPGNLNTCAGQAHLLGNLPAEQVQLSPNYGISKSGQVRINSRQVELSRSLTQGQSNKKISLRPALCKKFKDSQRCKWLTLRPRRPMFRGGCY